MIRYVNTNAIRVQIVVYVLVLKMIVFLVLELLLQKVCILRFLGEC